VTRLAVVVDGALQRPALVVGSLPPAGRDLDLLVPTAHEQAVRAALTAAGCARRRRVHARLRPGSVDSVDVITPRDWGLVDAELAAAIDAGTPVPGYRSLVAPPPDVALLLLARRLAAAGALAPRHRERLTELLRSTPDLFDQARDRAPRWHVTTALAALEQAWRTGRDPDAQTRARMGAERAGAVGPRTLRGALPVALRARLPRRSRAGVIAISGLDGAGKSGQAETLRDTLRALDVDAVVEWRRLSQNEALDAVARPVKKALRSVRGRGGGAPAPARVDYSRSERDAESLARSRSRLLTWCWAVVVATTHALSQRAAVRSHLRAGRVVICDRYTLDSVVHLRFRYGVGGLPAWLVRALPPRPVRTYYLDIPPAESLRRKDDGYHLDQLDRIHAGYAAASRRLPGVTVVDGTQPFDDVAEQVARDVWPRLP
jgi:thymidylate kinase